MHLRPGRKANIFRTYIEVNSFFLQPYLCTQPRRRYLVRIWHAHALRLNRSPPPPLLSNKLAILSDCLCGYLLCECIQLQGVLMIILHKFRTIGLWNDSPWSSHIHSLFFRDLAKLVIWRPLNFLKISLDLSLTCPLFFSNG